jgi:hypothetical protein
MERVARTTIAEQTGVGQVKSQKNYAAMGSHFGHARQGPESDPGKASELVERMEVCVRE